MRGEGKLCERFHKRLKQLYPVMFYYKIPDTAGLGGMRPFDILLIIQGVVFCIEAKVRPNKVTKYQRFCLDMASDSGAVSIILFDQLEDMNTVIGTIANCVKNKPKEEQCLTKMT